MINGHSFNDNLHKTYLFTCLEVRLPKIPGLHPERTFLQNSKLLGLGTHFWLKCFETFGVKNGALLHHFIISYLIVSNTLIRMQCEGEKKLYLFFLDKHISRLMSFLFMQHFDEFSVTYMNKMFFTKQHNGFLIVKIVLIDSLAHIANTVHSV